MLIFLSQPSTSLPTLMSSMDMFGKLSGYKINIQKTQTVTFNFNPTDDLVTKYNLSCNKTEMRYLGINLTKAIFLSTLKLSQTSPDGIIYLFSVELQGLNQLKWWFCLLYLFLLLPVEISDQQFIEWQKLISWYNWMSKKPSIKLNVMQLSKDKGGMALPHLKDYYYAAQKRTWSICDLQLRTRWKEIDEGGSVGPPIQADKRQ